MGKMLFQEVVEPATIETKVYWEGRLRAGFEGYLTLGRKHDSDVSDGGNEEPIGMAVLSLRANEEEEELEVAESSGVAGEENEGLHCAGSNGKWENDDCICHAVDQKSIHELPQPTAFTFPM